MLLHCAFVGLHFYYYINNKLLELNDLTQVAYKYYLILREKNKEYLKIKKIWVVELDKNLIRNIIRWSQSEINPFCTFLGDIV